MYAEIAIHVPAPKTFHYEVPAAFVNEIRPGHMVQVAFRTRLEPGIIIRLSKTYPDDIPPDIAMKPVEDILHPDPLLSDAQIALAQWIAYRDLSSVAAAVWLMLPPGITGGRDIRVILTRPDAPARDLFEHRLIGLLRRRGPLTGAQINNALQDERKADWKQTVDRLADDGILRVIPVLRPPRIRPRNIRTAMLTIHPEEIDFIAPHLGKKNRRADLLETIAGMNDGPHSAKDIIETLGTTKKTLQKMAKDGLLTIEEDDVSLAVPQEQIDDLLIDMRDAHTHIKMLHILARETDPIDVSWVYAQSDGTLDDLKRLEEAGAVLLGEQTAWRDQMADYTPNDPPVLTDAQADVLDPVIDATQENRHETFLLHGVTGSGKTEIYLRAMQAALDQGKTAIFLVPEIALTPQTAQRVAGRFPGRVTVMHSGMSDGERHDAWRRAREGLVQIVVGPRSALFVPLRDIGLIVLDEEHDSSYKQSPSMERPPFKSGPHYHARAVAAKLADLHAAALVLGSATPSIEAAYQAHRGRITYLKLPERIIGHREVIAAQAAKTGVQPRYDLADEDAMTIDLPPVEVVDMRAELKADNTSMFSRSLQAALHETLSRNEQAILFLNRRGKHTYVFCRDCGYVSACPHDEMPLTYHFDGAMRCHHCGHNEPVPRSCPNCQSRRIKFFGAGTQEVETELQNAFPSARVLRWDADTAAEASSHEKYLRSFIDHQSDIIVGTQMIAKGLDLPLVTLVGVINADTALNLPDFRASERTFQLMTQVAGRAGRGLLGGRVVLQTYQPDHYAIDAASHHDFRTFYEREIQFRRDLGYPPLRRIVRVVLRYDNEVDARSDAERLADRLRERIRNLNLTDTTLIGPAPCFFTRVGRYYRWHLLLRGPNPARALRGVSFEKNWYVDVDPIEIL